MAFNNTEQAALAVISRWMGGVRPKWFRWCCQCHQPVVWSFFYDDDGMCASCRRDNICDDYYGPYPAGPVGCKCFRCEDKRAYIAEHRGKRDKISGVFIK